MLRACFLAANGAAACADVLAFFVFCLAASPTLPAFDFLCFLSLSLHTCIGANKTIVDGASPLRELSYLELVRDACVTLAITVPFSSAVPTVLQYNLREWHSLQMPVDPSARELDVVVVSTAGKVCQCK